MLAAAARRYLLLFAAAAGVTVALSGLFALVAGSSVRRALALGFYLIGSFLLIAGFFVGSRGRARPVSDENERGSLPFLSARRVRSATVEEERETISASAIFISLGVSLLVVGVVVDSQAQLV
jgi:hypothetical protein